MEQDRTEQVRQLLPSGFHDVLPPDAGREARLVALLAQRMSLFGYMQVKPPLLEFEDSLLGGDASLARQTFRVMDPASGRYMGIRPDMTVQIARIAGVRLKDAARPLRLSYTGQVIRVEGEGLYAERQLSQVGAELIGSPAPEADAEVVQVATEALSVAGIANITVDFSLPTLAGIILEESGLSASERENVQLLVARKDISALRHLAVPVARLLADLLHLAGDAQNALTALKNLPLPEKALPLIAELAAVVARLEQRTPDIMLSIDPLETCGFNYHNGVAFTLFASGAQEELGRGGRYALANGESAVGFTLSANAVLRTQKTASQVRRIYIPYGTPSAEAFTLRDAGFKTILGLAKVDDVAEAKRLLCHAVLTGGKVVDL